MGIIKNLKTAGQIDDEMITDYILPSKITAFEGGIAGAENLLDEKPLQIEVGAQNCAKIAGAGFIVLDFGREISGGVRIMTHTVSGRCKIRLRFGESVGETYSDVTGVDFAATNDHSIRDFETELVSYSDMEFGQTGFRFVRLDFLSGFPAEIKSVIGVFTHRKLKREGSFLCDDEKINEIFETAADTAELCMQNMLWDGIKRDRLVWAGDMHPEALSIIALFGLDKCLEKSIDYLRETTPLPNFMNGMPAYSLWWLRVVCDYYAHNKNEDFFARQKGYIKDLTDLTDSLVDKNGVLNFSGYFLDWPSQAYPDYTKAGVFALCSFAFEKLKRIYSTLGLDTAKISGILNRINKNLDGGPLKQVNALKVMGGHTDPESVSDILLEGGAKGLSTFMSYYILSAISKAGQTPGALCIMKEYYGAMLDRGATSFWEDFDMDWLAGSGRIDELPKSGQKDIHGDFGNYCYKGFRHSLCHGWSSGPVPFLMRCVLGVNETGLGCETLEIKPKLCGLGYVKGQYPTPYGTVKIEHKKMPDGKIKTDVDAPREIKIIS